jgi:hypothetical protein
MKLQQAKQLLIDREKDLADARDKGYKNVYRKGKEVSLTDAMSHLRKVRKGINRRMEGRRTICDVK